MFQQLMVISDIRPKKATPVLLMAIAALWEVLGLGYLYKIIKLKIYLLVYLEDLHKSLEVDSEHFSKH